MHRRTCGEDAQGASFSIATSAVTIAVAAIAIDIYQWRGALPLWVDEEDDRAQCSRPLHGRSCRLPVARTERAVRMAGSGTRGHDRPGNRGNGAASRAAAFRDSDCRRGCVGRSTVDGADCRRGFCPAVLDQSPAVALSFRGQALHGRYPLRIAASGSRCVGDRGRPLRGPRATCMAVVDRSRRRPLGFERCVARDSCVRDLSVCCGLAARRWTRRGMVRHSVD